MNEGALLQAVCESPDDDAVRLVFADWCEENGDSDRAEFIRNQIALVRSPASPDAQTLRTREAALLKARINEWIAPLAGFASDYFGRPFEFRRGFVDSIGSETELLLDEGDQLFDLAPISEIRLAEEEEYGDLAKCRWLLRLRALDLTALGLSRSFEPAKLFRSRYLANLTTLRLCKEGDNGHLDLPGVKALRAAKHLSNLEELDLSGNWLNQFAPTTLATFLRTDNLPSLRVLRLARIGLAEAEAEALAATAWLARVKILDLSDNDFGDREMQTLLASPVFEDLEWIDLRDNRGREDSQPISASTRRQLRERWGERVLV